jgi:protein TonB
MSATVALVVAIGAAMLVAGCSTAPTTSETSAGKPRGTRAEAASEATSGIVSVPGTPKAPSPLDLYKQSAARHIVAKNRAHTFDDVPEHFLRSIVVLRIVVDGRGTVKTVLVDRGNGYTNLERAAVKAVRDSSPLPAPPPSLVRLGTLEYSESFLFRKDNRFQVRSIALEQPDPSAPRPLKTATATPPPAAPQAKNTARK